MHDRLKKQVSGHIAAIILIAIFLFLSGCSAKPVFIASAGKNIGFKQVDDEKAVLQNERLKLEIDSADGNIAVTDLQNNITYYATDPNGVAENWVSGPLRMKFLSQLYLNVLDKYGTMSSIDSSKGAIRENGFLVRKSENALQSVYRFKDYKIEITVEYRLDNDRLVVTVPVNRIRCDGTYTLADINLLPFFAAAGPKEKGQLLLPSGSGSLIYFGNGKSGTAFSEEIYGTDPMHYTDYKTEESAMIALPMFAYMYEDRNSSLMAYIEKGAALASLNANASYGEVGATAASFSFNYHPYALVNPLNTKTQSVKYNMPTSERVDIDEFSVSYQFFSSRKTYFDLAGEVKNRLSKQMKGTGTDTSKHPLYLEMIMGINKTVYSFGLPHKTCYPLTTISSAAEIAGEYAGESIYMVLNGIDRDGVYGGKIDTGFSIDSHIGTIKEYKNLENKLSENGGKLYSVTEPTRFTRSSFVSGAAKSVNGKNVEIYTYRNGDGQKNLNITPLNLLHYNKIDKAVSSFVQSVRKNGIKYLAPFSISNTPYTCNADYGDRSKVHTAFIQAAKKYTDNGIGLMLKAPDAEMLPYADSVFAAPIVSSGARIFDEDIPFLQLVLNGLISYSVPSVNEDGDSQLSLLKALESGSSLAYTLYTSDFLQTEKTAASSFIGSEFSIQKTVIQKNIKEYNKVMESLDGTITGHRILSPGIHLTEYGKNSILINYTDSPAKYGEKTVPAMSFVLLEEAEVNE